jgi:hypothetical protein
MGFVFIKQFLEFPSVCISWDLLKLTKVHAICLSCHLDQVEAFIEMVVNTTYSLLQRYYTENSKKIFPEMKLRGLIPNSYIHVSVRKYKSFTDK